MIFNYFREDYIRRMQRKAYFRYKHKICCRAEGNYRKPLQWSVAGTERFLPAARPSTGRNVAKMTMFKGSAIPPVNTQVNLDTRRRLVTSFT